MKTEKARKKPEEKAETLRHHNLMAAFCASFAFAIERQINTCIPWSQAKKKKEEATGNEGSVTMRGTAGIDRSGYRETLRRPAGRG